MSHPVEIPCPCPGSPHETDTVSLREKLGLAAGIAIQRMVIEANQTRPDTAELTGKLAEGYLLYGVEVWTLVDESGRAVPVTETTIRHLLLDDFSVSAPIAEEADGLYMTAVIDPLVKRAQTSSPTTPTNGSTSPPRPGTATPRKRSKRSSTTTTLTDSTEVTSAAPAGASN